MTDAYREANERPGWRCHWTHPEGKGRTVGEVWPDRQTAEDVAMRLRYSGCRDVEVHYFAGVREAKP